MHTIHRIRTTEPNDSLLFFQQFWISRISFLGEKDAPAALTIHSHLFALQAGCCELFSLQEVSSPSKLQVRPFLWLLKLLLFNSLQCVSLILSGESKVPGGLAADLALSRSVFEEQDSSSLFYECSVAIV